MYRTCSILQPLNSTDQILPAKDSAARIRFGARKSPSSEKAHQTTRLRPRNLKTSIVARPDVQKFQWVMKEWAILIVVHGPKLHVCTLANTRMPAEVFVCAITRRLGILVRSMCNHDHVLRVSLMNKMTQKDVYLRSITRQTRFYDQLIAPKNYKSMPAK